MIFFAVYVVTYDIFKGWWDIHKVPIHELIQVGIFFLLFIMCEVCFLRTSLTNPGWIYAEETEGSVNSFIERKANGRARICNKCKAAKPDRAHHCSICNRCVLKMDHHCPFVNNCIGFFNYKYFFTFLFWVILYCIYVIIMVIMDGVSKGEYSVPGVIAGGLCVVVLFMVSILFSNHIRFVTQNVTTIEFVEKRKVATGNQYDVGMMPNLHQIFGKNPLLWPLPIWTSSGNGYTYTVKPENPDRETSLLLSNTV